MSPEQFKAWRKRRQLTQVEAAKLLHLSPSTIMAYETAPSHPAKHRPVPALVERFLKALDAEATLRRLQRRPDAA